MCQESTCDSTFSRKRPTPLTLSEGQQNTERPKRWDGKGKQWRASFSVLLDAADRTLEAWGLAVETQALTVSVGAGSAWAWRRMPQSVGEKWGNRFWIGL
ncbi:hypothetical protein Ct61P_08595 [Colletotrichum tofieldiae]|nr:hypothetical protein Ct61P_08595 [Colletotrichum tofieldiae]